jgi:endonuclease/exonuclease/phosphatase family metal-dependent hydrolase
MQTYSIGFWNLENLFAPEGFVGRLDWLERRIRKDIAGLTDQLFERKIAQLTKGIAGMNGGDGPDILGVCEVENRFVLDTLIEALDSALPGREYHVVHADSLRDKRGIDTAILFDAKRFTADPALIFSHFVLRRTGTRDILQATFTSKAGGNSIVLLCNHWPSRSGGQRESAGFRATAGETLAYWHERIREEAGSDTAILALGDFNDDPHDPSLQYNAVAWRERGDVERSRTARFYNLGWRLLSQTLTTHSGTERPIDGTLYFGGNGFVFDQILANKALLDGSGPWALDEDSTKIDALPEMVSHRVSEGPLRFGLPKGNADKYVNEDGFSDHFPVSVTVTEEGA